MPIAILSIQRLEALSDLIESDVTDESGYNRDYKVIGREYVPHRLKQ